MTSKSLYKLILIIKKKTTGLIFDYTKYFYDMDLYTISMLTKIKTVI